MPMNHPSSFQQTLQHTCKGEVHFDQTTRGIYATDASIYQITPRGVVIPASTDDACDALGVLADARIAVLPRGGGTSLAGQCVNDAVVLDLSAHCTRLLSIDSQAHQCTVESGLTIEDLNDQLASTGLFFAPDPSTARQATIAGCIGNNAAGAHSILYGRTSDNVLGIDACLWDGTKVTFDQGAATRHRRVRAMTEGVLDCVERHADNIRQRFPKTMRRSSGYQLDIILQQLDEFGRDLSKINLAPLLGGSEGTLALTLAATLRLHPKPKAKALAVLSFASIEDAIGAVQPIMELNPSAVELLDQLILDLARNNTACKPYIELLPKTPSGGTPNAVLYVEFFSDSGIDEIHTRFGQLHSLFPANQIQIHTNADAMNDAWALRKAGEPLLHAIAGARKPLGFVEDNAVPVRNLGEFVDGFRAILEDEGTIASYYAHASVGVLHVRPLLDLRDSEDQSRMIRIAQRVAQLAQSLGGVPSGEHGDGRARGPLLEPFFGPELMEAFREIKAIFDPHNLMNPGNIVAPGPIEFIARNTRICPETDPIQVPKVETLYSYESQDGFGHAIERCNGAGVCRKKTVGTMCPSYQATLDERHSTRGRGNALRLAITGQTKSLSDGPAWNDPGTLEVLDWCLGCKACKSECPSNVDLAKLKAEYLAQSFAHQDRTPKRARIFSHIHTLNRLASVFPSLTNTLNRFPPARSVLNNALDIHPSRSLPAFFKPYRQSSIPRNGKPKVLVLSDTFSTHNDPGVTAATVRVLEAFGYAVGVKCVSDLGRAAISQGCLPRAIRDAERTLDQLTQEIEDSSLLAFVIPEPSCLSAVCDDWKDLKINRPAQLCDELARRSALPETFLDVFWDRHPVIPSFHTPPGIVKIHGHCHHKALWGDQSPAAIFKRLFPDQTEMLDTGCCGMAGAFGYAAHKFDLSMKIGEQRLFPAVRGAGEHDIIVASGTSCRHQIADGTGRRSFHAIEVLDQLLDYTGAATR